MEEALISSLNRKKTNITRQYLDTYTYPLYILNKSFNKKKKKEKETTALLSNNFSNIFWNMFFR